eukprot:11220121-Alexandrium_andersonii.AAC.1
MLVAGFGACAGQRRGMSPSRLASRAPIAKECADCGLADCGLERATSRFCDFGPRQCSLSWADSESTLTR